MNAGASIGGCRKQRQRWPECVLTAIGAALAVLVWAFGVAPATAAAPTGGGRWWLTSVPEGRATRDVRVWLPPSYDQPAAASRRYPVVVFLHGWPGSEGNWPGQGRAGETLGALITAGRIPELIGLFPDGNGSGLFGRSLWLDSWDGRVKLETFLAHGLLAWADSALRTRPDALHRALIGLSDGGTGALNLLLRHPGVYGAAGAHSGEYLLPHDVSSRALFGPEPGASRLRDEYSPLLTVIEQAAELSGVTLYLDCGSDDTDIDGNRALHARLDSLGVKHMWAEFPSGHDWGYWRTHLVQSLEAVTKGMR